MQRRRVRVFGAFGRRRDDLVVARDLEHALGAARRGGDEHDQFLLLARPADFGDPVLHAAAELDDRLTRDVPRSRVLRASSPTPSLSMLSCSSRTADASRSATVSRPTNNRSGGATDPGAAPRVVLVSLMSVW